MEDFKKMWQKVDLDESSLDDLLKNELSQIFQGESKSYSQLIQKQIQFKLVFTIGMTMLIVGGINYSNNMAGRVLLMILLGAYVIGTILLYQEYSIIKRSLNPNLPLKESLNRVRNAVLTIISKEQLIGLLLYPITIAAGFIIGLEMTHVDELPFPDDFQLLLLSVCIITLTPASHLLTKWMNKVAFEDLLRQLDSHIHELDSPY
ncbi:MAG: hypothetical protein JXQ90_02770 [Cyclobacteriaceae bacterium]